MASGVLVASTRPRRSRILRRFWAMTVNSPMTRSDRVATLEEATEIRSDRIAIFSKNLLGRMILSEKSATFRRMLRHSFRRARDAWKAGGKAGGDRLGGRTICITHATDTLFVCLSMCVPRVLPPLWRGSRRPWMPKRQGLSAARSSAIRLELGGGCRASSVESGSRFGWTASRLHTDLQCSETVPFPISLPLLAAPEDHLPLLGCVHLSSPRQRAFH